MAYQGDDRRGGGDNRWRDRDDRWGRGGWDRDRDFGRSEQGRGGWEGRGSDRGEDRGFFERAGDEVRSWFGGRPDDRGYDDPRGGSYGWMSRGWGNQAGDSWNRDRPGVRDEREGWFTDSIGGERGRRYGGPGGSFDEGRSGGRGYGSGYEQTSRSAGSAPGYSGAMRERGGHDPHYSEWRQRQIEELDRDYDEWRREHQSRFEQEFGTWRSKRQSQRQMLTKVTEHMDVVGSDGSHVGTVDDVRGDRIILTKSDADAGGIHHSIPCSWVETVEDGKVTLNRTADQAMTEWRNEERSRALFEREDSGSEGPHMLNRSFSGTYSDRDD